MTMNRHRWIGFVLATLVTSLSLSPAIAETVVFDLRAPTDGINAGNDLEDEEMITGNMHTAGGITVTASAMGGAVNGTAAGMGVNADANNDDRDAIEAAFGESLSFTINFAGFTVDLVSIDFKEIGQEDDSAIISINDVTAIELHTGVDDFNGTSDVWTPAETVPLISGDKFTFSADIAFALEEITLETSLAGADNANFNSDAGVDGHDLLIWQQGFGTGNTLAAGDANSSGAVDMVDLLVWGNQYGSSGVSISAVPEPSVLLLAFLGTSFTLFRRRVIC
ncbi:PEP-CTERM sorting domain-containing protein [Adhaeretor mobilis]|uniref:PEP-CTERM protein-sorting domain-containing protein n=1 Tax=Adhaeretor mobilis TaxID=1930276 RepID=A0A517MUP6_9BACT|nr:PEP-CTERM sorting domain-containing protein [Adhaeretor mobilis]QDS98600.1 hypothetical protein HG15A2_18810 [Adhaeretor mobilis]